MTVMTPEDPTPTLPVATAQEARRELGRSLAPHWRGGMVSLAVLVVAVSSGLVVPPVLGQIIDIARAGDDRGDLVVPLLVLAGATLLQGLAGSGGWYIVVWVGESALATLRERVLDHALALPQSTIERGGSGDLVSRVSNDVDKVSEALRRGVPELMFSGATVVLTVGGLAILDWRFALAGLISLPFYAWATHGYTVVTPRLWAAERAAEGARSQQLVETLAGVQTIRALRLGKRHLGRVDAASEEARVRSIKAADATAWFWSRMHLGELTGTAAVLLVGAYLVGTDAASLGEATAAALYFIRLYDPIGALIYLLDDVQSATASLRRLAGIMLVPLDKRPGAELSDEASLRLSGVRFGYDDGPDVLHGVDLDVRPGEHVALVGGSGAGKTTIAALVAGIHEPRAGRIELGGVDIGLLPRDQLSQRVALLTQEVHVFAGSLAEDLRLARADATDDELHAVLATVGAQPWVNLLAEGLETRVGTGGHLLTPVQAQQLALARLVLRDPRVWILDEATAEAGSSGARELEASISRVLHGRTALLVAHRITTAAAADRVVVLAEGRVVEQGPPSQLVQADGPYAKLWRAWHASRPGS